MKKLSAKRYIIIYIICIIILFITTIFQNFINYLSIDTYETVKIHNYIAHNILILEDNDNLILVDLDKSIILVSYPKEHIKVTKEEYVFMKDVKTYTLYIELLDSLFET